MSKHKGTNAVLSVSVTPTFLEAVVLQKEADEVRILRRIIRQRQQGAEVSKKRLATALPGLKSTSEADYSLEIGGGGDGGSLFLATEFAGLGTNGKSAGKESKGDSTSPEHSRQLFTTQLAAIIDECHGADVHNPTLVFVAGAPDVTYAVLNSGAEAEKTRKDGARARKPASGAAERKRLYDLLVSQRTDQPDAGRVAFLPMAKVDGRQRHLAVVPEPKEPVSATLAALVEQERNVPTRRIMDADLSAFMRLVRKSVAADRAEQTTAFVRVGSEETLIAFFAGHELRHYERLRSLSTFDAPETVCSRILLQQDEQKVGEVQHVILLVDGRPDQLFEAFKRFYPDAVVELAQDVLKTFGVKAPHGADGIASNSVAAIAAGLRVLENWDQDFPDLDVHLLPKKIQRDRRKVAFGWHTLLMAVVVFVLAGGFTWRYMDQQQQIERERAEMRANPVTLPVDNPALLKMRVDSLHNAYMTYTQALHILDSLLVGSDRWTRTHERLTRSTGEIGGIWLKNFRPMGRGIAIEGVATTRSKVAQFARRHSASIEGLASVAVKHQSRDITLYEFTAVAPVPSETPRVALYLQEAAAGIIKDAAVDSVLARYRVDDLYAPGEGASVTATSQP